MHKLLGDGEVIDAEFEDSPNDSGLRTELAKVKAERDSYRRELETLKSSIVNLRKSLSPLYASLKGLFGEMDKFHVSESPASNGKASIVWENWKRKMPGHPARIIDALLLHRSMTATQLQIAADVPAGSFFQVISKMNKVNLLTKNGNMYELRQL